MSFEMAVTRELMARSLQLTERVLASEPDGKPDANVKQLHEDLVTWHKHYGEPKPCGGLPDDYAEAWEDWHLR